MITTLDGISEMVIRYLRENYGNADVLYATEIEGTYVFCFGSKSGYIQFVRVFEVGQGRQLMHSIDKTIRNAYNRNAVNDGSIDTIEGGVR